MRESEIQREILNWLSASDILAWRCNLGGVRIAGKGMAKNPMKGFPDIAGVMPRSIGHLFAIEVKTSIGRLSPEQMFWRERLEAKGVFYILARSRQDVSDLLSERGRVGA